MNETIFIQVGRYRLPVHKRKDTKTGQIRYRVRFTKDVNNEGKRKEFDLTDLTIEGLSSKVENTLHPYQYLLNPEHQSILFATVTELWYASASITWEESTKQRYRTQLNTYILPFTKNMRLVEVNADFLQQLFSQLSESEIAVTVLHSIKSLFNSIFNFCIQRQLIMANPCRGLYLPKKVYNPQEALSESEQNLLLKAFSMHPEDEGIIAALLFTGARCEEALGLTWDKINLETGLLRIDSVLSSKKQNGKNEYYIRNYTKNRRSRTIVLSQTAISFFIKQREWQNKMKKAAKNNWNEPIPNLIFTDPFGKPVIYGSFERRFKKIMNAVTETDLSWVHPHTLRHTAASNYFHITHNIVKTAEFLGHADIHTTLIYTHARFEDKKEIADKLDHIHKRAIAQ